MCVCVCTCCLQKICNKNQGTDFSFSSKPNVFFFFFFFFFFSSRSVLSGWQGRSMLMWYKGVDGKDNPPMGSWHNIKKKRRKWEEEIAIVSPLTLPSNYARVKARVTKKMILVLNHLPYFVDIKKALVLTTFQSHSFPPTLKMYQESRLTKIWIKWLYYKEHFVCEARDGLLVMLNCVMCNTLKVKYTLYYYKYFR